MHHTLLAPAGDVASGKSVSQSTVIVSRGIGERTFSHLQDLAANGRMSVVAGYPRITVPAGRVEGLPVGLSFLGGPLEEGRLFPSAVPLERASQVRRPPTSSAALTG